MGKMKPSRGPYVSVVTPESVDALSDAMREFLETTDYDVLPDLETAKALTDAADRRSPDYGPDDEPAPAPAKKRPA